MLKEWNVVICNTVRLKNVCPWMFDNFGKCGLISKMLSLIDLYENSLRKHHKYFQLTCSMLLHYLVKFENPKM